MEVTKIKITATYSELLEAMKHPQTGVGFLTQSTLLPSQTFLSADAVQWLNRHIEGGVSLEWAVNTMKVRSIFVHIFEMCFIKINNNKILSQGMIQEKLICHASGDFSKPFIVGFYLFYIVQDKEKGRE